MNERWPDIALLGYIAFFAILCAVLIIKETRVGWALFAKCVAYGVAFGYGALTVARPELASEDHRRLVRGLVALAITWAIYELIALRVRLWRESRR
jgi:uncharacterized membrane protein